jgi:pimeloyl-ACP methyl ester carboxylesterase
MRYRAWAGVVVLTMAVAAMQPVRATPSDPHATGSYSGQEIVWQPCFKPASVPPGLPRGSEALECGSYRVPRDWGAPETGVDLTIAVSRLRLGGARAEGSLLTNPGGPGGPGRTLPLIFLRPAAVPVLAHYEVIGIDVRGTGDSTNVSCGLQAGTGYTLDPRDRAAENTGLILDATEYVARTCRHVSKDLGPFITTEQTVRDLDLLRQLLGRERINWVGYSGGTWLGAYYATYFPERAGRFVLDSNAEFTAPWQRVFLNQPLGFQRRFEADFLPYAAAYDAYFGLGATPDKVKEAYENLRAQLAAEPLDVTEGMTVYPTDLDGLLTGAMYSKTGFQSAAEDLGTLRAAVAGRGSPGAPGERRRRQALVADLRQARRLGRYGGTLPLAADAFDATFQSITCNDTPWQGDRTSLLAESQRLGEAYPLTGWYALGSPCVFWRRPAVGLKTPTGHGVPPVLMVQTERDPATPIEGARRAQQGFAGARLLTVVNEGDHGAYLFGGNDCVDGAVDTYLVDGVVPAEGASCPGDPIPPPVPVANPSGLPDELAGLADLLGGVLGEVARLADLVGPLPL